MVCAGAFSRRIQSRQIGPVVRVHQDTSHKVMDAGGNRYGFHRRIYPEVMADLSAKVRQPLLPYPFLQACHIQEEVCRPLRHLTGNHITGHQVSARTVLFFHEIALFPILQAKQPAAFSPGRFRDQKPLSRNGNRRRMILYKLQIAK